MAGCATAGRGVWVEPEQRVPKAQTACESRLAQTGQSSRERVIRALLVTGRSQFPHTKPRGNALAFAECTSPPWMHRDSCQLAPLSLRLFPLSGFHSQGDPKERLPGRLNV